jgi:hypothetical protein
MSEIPFTQTCQFAGGRGRNGFECGCRALWLVSVGTRRTDAQYSCGLHLSSTCTALLSAEDRPEARLHVVPG